MRSLFHSLAFPIIIALGLVSFTSISFGQTTKPATAPTAAQIGAPAPAPAPAGKTTVRIGMVLEPPSLDPTMGAAAAIGEISFYNIFESLVHITSVGGIEPMLADSWDISGDMRHFTFHLHPGLQFHNGVPLTAKAVAYSLTRAASKDSTNKDKAFFASITTITVVDDLTITLDFADPDSTILFHLGMPTAAIVEETSAEQNATTPIGTGPYRFVSWQRGVSVTLERAPSYKGTRTPAITQAIFRFIADPTAETAAMLSGDLDAFPRFAAIESLSTFKNDSRFAVTLGGTEGKTIMAMNNKRPPLDNVLVRRAIAGAIDKQAVIDGAMDGFGKPISSHMTANDEGYVDVSGLNPYNVERAKDLLAQAALPAPPSFTLILPPPAYARRAGEIIASQLAAIGMTVKIQNVEWAQWLSSVYGGNHDFDLTIISHVEPLDLGIYANPNYYFGYDSQAFRDIYNKIRQTPDIEARVALIGEAQKLLATDCVNVFLFQLPQITVADKKLKGLWRNAPIFVNDLASLRWEG